jgi:multicomponent Na+:H+ antiporter subunit G
VANLVVGVLLVLGSSLMFVAALGILRMPDLFTRMQATTKAATLGVGMLLAAAAVNFGDLAVTTRVIAAAVFIAMTLPVAAHLLGRAAYFLGVPLWERSVRDDLRGRYDELAHELASIEELVGDERLAPGRAARRGTVSQDFGEKPPAEAGPGESTADSAGTP